MPIAGNRPEPLFTGTAVPPILEAIQEIWPVERWAEVNIVLGVSGGADSVALARALHLLRDRVLAPAGRMFLAHFDHGLRPQSAEEERDLVARLAEQLSAELISGRNEVIRPSEQRPSEDQLRQKRYDFFRMAMRQTGSRYLVLAHHRDDQIETIVQRLLRGTGIRGICGMSTFRPFDEEWVIARPLLKISRVALRKMLVELGQEFREDPSNSDTALTRNWLRHELIPQIVSRFPHALESLIRLSEQAQENQQALRGWADQLIERSVYPNLHGFEIDCPLLQTVPPIILGEMLNALWLDQGWSVGEMTHEKWGAVIQLIQKPSFQSIDLPGSIRAARSGNRISIFLCPHPADSSNDTTDEET